MSKPEPKPIKPPKVLLTPNQAAEVLHMAPSTLVNWRVRRQGPPFIKVGGAVRYCRADLDAWLEAQTVHEIPRASNQ